MWKSLQEYETGNFRDMFEITSLMAEPLLALPLRRFMEARI